MAKDAAVDAILRLAMPKPEHGFRPTDEQRAAYEKYLGVVRPMLAQLVPPHGFSRDEWVVCSAYLLISSGIMRAEPLTREEVSTLACDFRMVWPDMFDKLAAHMGESWAKIETEETAASKQRLVAKSIEIDTNPDTGMSDIRVKDQLGREFVFHSTYPLSIGIDNLPTDSTVETSVTFEYGSKIADAE